MDKGATSRSAVKINQQLFDYEDPQKGRCQPESVRQGLRSRGPAQKAEGRRYRERKERSMDHDDGREDPLHERLGDDDPGASQVYDLCAHGSQVDEGR